MSMNRRDFLKSAVAGGGGLLLASQPGSVLATPPRELPHEAVGILYDATLCIGCKSCMVACKKFNSQPGGALVSPGRSAPPYEYRDGLPIWDAPTDLSSRTLSIIKVYRNGAATHKDTVADGYSFVKQHCLHCLSPACVSVCPVGALHKDPATGIVAYSEDKCIGCRYCMLACPFRIPRYEYESASPQVRKCQLCQHRIAAGDYSACCEFCPTGASLFGRVADLRDEARRRLALKPGQEYAFPLQRLGAGGSLSRPVARYENRVYGLNEAGGTQYLLLAGVPFELLGFDKNLREAPLPDLTWGYIKKIPALIVGVLAVSAVTAAYTSRRSSGKED